jgi:peptide/nickel transport system substrate-binding protein
MTAALSKSLARHRANERGFTLIELLVVIVILGILAAVVVFAVGGTGDKGQNAAVKTDAETLRTAQEAHCARLGRYATSDQELVSSQFLSEESQIHEVVAGGFGQTSCGSYIIDATEPGFGQAEQVDTVRLGSFPSPTPGGFPSPFAFGQGPGFNNMHYIFDSLTWKDGTGNYIPWLATGLGVTGTNGTGDPTVTYTLRDGVKFSNGDFLTADDVVFTYDYITIQDTDPATAGNRTGGANIPGSFYYSVNYIKEVTQTGANPLAGTGGAVTFALNDAFAPFEAMFGSRIPILPKGIWQDIDGVGDPGAKNFGSPLDPNKATNAALAVTGSGPYTLDNPAGWTNGPPSSYAFTARTAEREASGDLKPAFYLGDPFVRRLEYMPTGAPNPLGQLPALQNGTIDGASAPDGTPPPPSLNAFDRIDAPGENVQAIHFNLRTGAARTGANVSPNSFPYDEPAFRQAIAYALDRPQLVGLQLKNRGEVGSMGALAPSNFFANPNLPTYERDLVRAGQLLDGLGIVDGPDADNLRELPSTGVNFTPTIRSQSSTGNLNSLVEGYLDALNIDFTIVAGVGIPEFTAGNYDIGMLGYGAMGAEPDQLRNRLSGTDPDPQFTDVFGWNNTEFETLAYEQVSELNPTVRRQKLNRMQELVAQDVPLISLYLPQRTWVYSDKPVPWYFTPGGLWAGWPGAPSKQLFVDGTRADLRRP